MENTTAYQISSSMNDGILELVITGTAIGNEFEKMMLEMDSIMEANNAKEVILDIRIFKEHIESITTIYQYTVKHNFFLHRVKTAVVDFQEKTSFAMALKNAGVPVERFIDMDLARKWIKSNPIKETWEKETMGRK
jgi:hypothetical protein